MVVLVRGPTKPFVIAASPDIHIGDERACCLVHRDRDERAGRGGHGGARGTGEY